ncbi:site-specific DNA-methyltransferase [Deinococcus deserti]|uniref:Methyltransferase n=1 Tax=Deinococcus deserti (strain DSM 17065 / CIP 109153 / LMG 22923 / VCD115) TaxID=546414 RepID=C1CZ60_DEIDV|nr:site-specific DNA-methyltransferase [Deinococcus deserti]ACO45098.1 putative DNA methylase [Deinococcus deserti VCD115]
MPLEINQIHQGDSRKLLKEIDANSIDLSVWSPPYYVGKDYERYLESYQDWVNLLSAVIAEHDRILKPGGFMVINIADILVFKDEEIPRFQALNITKQRSAITREDVLAAKENNPTFSRYQLAELLGTSEQTIDRRLNGNNIRGGKYNTQTRVKLVGDVVSDAAHAARLYLYDRRIWAKDAAWENSKWTSLSYRSVDEFEYIYIFWKPGETVVDRRRLTGDEWKEWGSRGIWRFPSVRANDDHEAKFPLELPTRVIKLLTNPGDTVLDCFMGSGTTAVAATNLNRNFIGLELLPEYVALSRRNVAAAVQRGHGLLRQDKDLRLSSERTEEAAAVGLFD